MKVLERGDWCAEREPVLKSYAAGLAGDEERRQAEHHLSHCRHCADFVGRLTGHLHDLGGAVALPGAIDAIDDGHLALPGRLADAADRIRESAAGVLARGRQRRR